VWLCLAIVACNGGYYTSNVNGEKKVYRVGEQGEHTLVYETDRDGNTTIHDPEDTIAKQQAASEELAERSRARKAEQLEGLDAGPKRGPQDPIYVNLAPPVLDGKMQRAERSKGAVAQQLRNEFMSDPIIQLIPATNGATGFGKSNPGLSIVDVDVISKVSLKEVQGINRKTGKTGKMLAVVFEATITSQVPQASYTVSESGNVLKNVEVSKRFAQQVRQVILERIGPGIPAH
jgi:hypothetical protein